MKGIKSAFFVLLSLICNKGNAQLSWSAASDVASTTYGNTRPRIVVDASGNPMLLWGNLSQASLYFSRWTGTAFSTPVKLNPSWMQIATATWMGPDIASKGDTVYVVMKRIPETSDTNHIYIVRSFDGGQNFSNPVRVDYIGDSLSRFCTVTIDQQGHPIVAFMKFNSNFMDSRWVVTRSNDYGQTFQPDVKASGWGNSSEVCDCCPGALVYSPVYTAMLYRDNNNNIRDSWMGLSTNNGASFTQGANIDRKNWMIMSCPSTGPDGVIIDDSLYSVFTSAASGKYRVYFSRHSLANNGPGAVSNLSAELSGLGQQNYPRIASYKKSVAVAWRQSLNAKAELSFLFSPNIANGLPLKYDSLDLLDVTNTDVAMSSNKIYVVWQDDKSATVKYISAEHSQLLSVKNIAAKTQAEIFPNPAGNELRVRFNADKAEISFINMLGQIVLNEVAGNDKPVDISSLHPGLYLIKVTLDGLSSYQRLVKE